MRKSIKLLSFVWLLVSPVLSAQSPFTGDIPLIYRGKHAAQYTYRYNGHPYWEKTDFGQGDVMFNGVLYEDIPLNIDAVRQELVVQWYAIQVAPEREQVSWFSVGGKLFVNLRYQGIDAESGFYEVIYDGPTPVFRQVNKLARVDVGNHNGRIIGYEDPNYDPDLLEYFQFTQTWWMYRDGQMVRLKNRKALQKAFGREGKQARRRIDRKLPDDLWMAALMREIEGGQPGSLTASLQQWHPDGSQPAMVPTAGIGPVRAAYSNSLPIDYFDPERKASEAVAVDTSSVIFQYRNKVYHIGEDRLRRGNRAQLSGQILDLAEGEPLQGVTIYDEQTQTYTSSDANGRYRISLPFGENVLHFMEFTKEDIDLKIVVHSDGTLDVSMTERVTELQSAMISAESMRNHRSAQIGVERISMQTANRIPSAFGEGDLIKAVLTLPGVKSVGEASAGFNVRGGSADQNLILFNDLTIWNPSHLFGTFSAFNPTLVEEVELYKSSIPAQFGGRISSVMDIAGKTGDMHQIKGSLGIGLLTSRFHIEGPLAKDRTSFIFGIRKSYSDWMLRQIPRKESAYSGGSADFADINLGLTHKIDERNTLDLTAYASQDDFAFSPDTTFRYHNVNAGLRWKRQGEESSLVVSTGYDRYYNRLDNYGSGYDAYRLKTIINEAYARAGFTRKNLSHTWIYGVNLTGYGLDGGIFDPLGNKSIQVADRLERELALEAAAYAGDTWSPDDRLSLDYGLRMAAFLTKGKTYALPEFRLSGKYSLAEKLTVKAGINSLNQYIHLISNTSSISPMDTWKLSDKDIRPTTGFQAAAGLYWTVFGNQLDLSLEGYWKSMFNHLDYKSGATLSMNHELAQDLIPVTGKAYGVEVMAKKTVGKLNGWIAYTYSRSFFREKEDRGVNTINGGAWYPAPYDKPHDVKVVANYALTRRYSFSLNVDYSTGRPITVPVGRYQYGGGYRLAFSERNASRIPDYFRIDAAINIDPGHYLRQLTHMTWTIGCYNILGRKNAYSVFYTTDHGTGIQGYMVSVFATQIPYINLNILF